MNRFACNHTGDIFPVCITHKDIGRGQSIGIPSTQCDKTQCSVGLDGMNHKTNFIAVGIQPQDRTIPLVFFPVNIKIAHMVFFNDTKTLAPGPGDSEDIVLKA